MEPNRICNCGAVFHSICPHCSNQRVPLNGLRTFTPGPTTRYYGVYISAIELQNAQHEYAAGIVLTPGMPIHLPCGCTKTLEGWDETPCEHGNHFMKIGNM